MSEWNHVGVVIRVYPSQVSADLLEGLPAASIKVVSVLPSFKAAVTESARLLEKARAEDRDTLYFPQVAKLYPDGRKLDCEPSKESVRDVMKLHGAEVQIDPADDA